MDRDDWPTVRRLLGDWPTPQAGIDDERYIYLLAAHTLNDIKTALRALTATAKYMPSASELAAEITRRRPAAKPAGSPLTGTLYGPAAIAAIGIPPPWTVTTRDIDGELTTRRTFYPDPDTITVTERNPSPGRIRRVISAAGVWDDPDPLGLTAWESFDDTLITAAPSRSEHDILKRQGNETYEEWEARITAELADAGREETQQ